MEEEKYFGFSLPFTLHSVWIIIAFLLQFEIRQCSASSFVLPYQDFFGYSGSSILPTHFRIIYFSFVKNPTAILMGVALTLHMA